MPDQLPRGMEPIVPGMAVHRRYMPIVGHILTVTLPGEQVRAEIMRVVSPDLVIAQIIVVPVATTRHRYVHKELINVRRNIGDHDVENWRAISEHELQQQELQAQLDMEARQREIAAAQKQIDEIRARDLAPQPAPLPAAPPRRTVLGPRRSKITRAA